jgi:hypothetical protein
MSKVLRKWLPRVVVMLSVASLGACFLVNRAVEEHYSSGWYSETTENAQYREVFVASPIVVPAVLRVGDSVELRVVDAWVERPTHVEYRWLVRRTEVQDSGYRLVVHLAQVPRDTPVWSYPRGRCFVFADFQVNGEHPAVSGNGDVRILVVEDTRPFTDTVRLAARVRARPPDAPKDPTSCPGV